MKKTDDTGCYVDSPTSMETYSGRSVDTVSMSEDDIDLVDVVHSLANTCRYGGHCRHFYSVAAHSIFVHDEAAKRGLPKMVLQAALLHDAGEAYWHDMGRPLKMAEGMGAYLA